MRCVLTDAGWIVQYRAAANLSAGSGVAVREFPLKGLEVGIGTRPRCAPGSTRSATRSSQPTFTPAYRQIAVRWQFLTHIVMHAAQQQADAATLLSLAGQSPGDFGFGEYLDTTHPHSAQG